MLQDELEAVIERKVKPLVETAMQKHLGITISEIETDITEKLKKRALSSFFIFLK